MNYCTPYVDGSGSYGWCRLHGKSQYKFHTLAGIMSNPESDLKSMRKVCEIMREYITDEVRNIRPATEYELRFGVITSGRGIYRKLSQDVREEIIGKTFELILELRPILIASTVDKINEMKKRREKAILPQLYAMRSVISKFSMHLNRFEKIGTVVYDEDKIQFSCTLQEEMQRYRREGIAITGQSYQPQPDNLPNILNNVNFCPYMSSGLQLADFVAGTVWRKYEENDVRYYKLLDPLWEYDQGADKAYRDSILS